MVLPLLQVSLPKFSFRVSVYPSLGGSTMSAKFEYFALMSCNMQSSKPFGFDSSTERDGVFIEKYIFS